MATIVDAPEIEELRTILEDIETYVSRYSLADAIREGSKVSSQFHQGYYRKGEACALSAAYLAVRARGLTD